MKDFGKKSAEYFAESSQLTERLARRFEATNEQHESTYAELMGKLSKSGKINEEALRNAIVLRSIRSVFLLGYKTVRISPDERTSWEKIVPFVIQKAQQLSLEEIQQLTDGGHEDRAVVKLANDLWTYIKEITPDAEPPQ